MRKTRFFLLAQFCCLLLAFLQLFGPRQFGDSIASVLLHSSHRDVAADLGVVAIYAGFWIWPLLRLPLGALLLQIAIAAPLLIAGMFLSKTPYHGLGYVEIAEPLLSFFLFWPIGVIVVLLRLYKRFANKRLRRASPG